MKVTGSKCGKCSVNASPFFVSPGLLVRYLGSAYFFMILHPSSKMSRLKPLHLGVLWGFQNKIAYSKPTDLGAMGCEILCFRGRMVSRILGHFPTEAFQIILSPGLLSLLTSLFCTYYMGPVLLSDIHLLRSVQRVRYQVLLESGAHFSLCKECSVTLN